jgi:hypothetical protein
MTCNRKLFEVVAALHPSCRFPHRLNSGQEQRDQNPDDRNHDKQFDKRETYSNEGIIVLDLICA